MTFCGLTKIYDKKIKIHLKNFFLEEKLDVVSTHVPRHL